MDLTVCALFSYLCLMDTWHSNPSMQHLLVSHMEDFSPQVVMPVWKRSMSFEIYLTGRGTETRVWRIMCVFTLSLCEYYCLLLYNSFTLLWSTCSAVLSDGGCVSLCPEACSICGFSVGAYLYAAEVWVFALRGLKRHRLSATPGESVQREMEKSGVSRREWTGMKVCP